MAVKGIQRVRHSLKQLVDDVTERRTEAALYAVLSSGASTAQTMVPMDTGTLLNSQYAPQITHTESGAAGVVGYTAEYALWVHQAPGKLKGQPRGHFGTTREGVAFGGGTGVGNYWDPAAEPRFLVKGFEAIKPSIPAILKREYSV